MAKKPQTIRGTFFPLDTIPDNAERFIELYGQYPQYKELERKEAEMRKDFKILNPDGQNTKSNKRTEKNKKDKSDPAKNI